MVPCHLLLPRLLSFLFPFLLLVSLLPLPFPSPLIFSLPLRPLLLPSPPHPLYLPLPSPPSSSSYREYSASRSHTSTPSFSSPLPSFPFFLLLYCGASRSHTPAYYVMFWPLLVQYRSRNIIKHARADGVVPSPPPLPCPPLLSLPLPSLPLLPSPLIPSLPSFPFSSYPSFSSSSFPSPSFYIAFPFLPATSPPSTSPYSGASRCHTSAHYVVFWPLLAQYRSRNIIKYARDDGVVPSHILFRFRVSPPFSSLPSLPLLPLPSPSSSSSCRECGASKPPTPSHSLPLPSRVSSFLLSVGNVMQASKPTRPVFSLGLPCPPLPPSFTSVLLILL